ncbi:MAG: SDR family NAD(P)-dependent oxidoreductase [Planctomycetota bacterium]|nr:SDR family NAD(P)-dependent oxidoreductase [Planctomycetota bacterium]
MLKGSKVLVTGGAGFIGSHIVDALVKEGANVVVYDNFVRGSENNLVWARANGRVEVVKGDILECEKLAQHMAGVDYVFHEAALWLLECEAEPRKAISVNILGTFNVLEACVNAGVKKIVAASSSSVYGNGSYFPTDEVHPFNNDLFYGATKVADEQIMRAFHKKHGLKVVGLRYLNAYGPRMDFRSAYVMVIMNFLNKLDAGEAPVILGDGSATLDLVYVEDVARANIIALKSEIECDFFNIASGKETTLRELLDTILKITGSKLAPVYEPRDARLVVRRFGCPKKASEVLGFTATTPNEAGLRRVIEWRRSEKGAHGRRQ